MQSDKWSLNRADLQRWAKNLLVFSSPLLIIFLTAIQNGTPLKDAMLLVYAALVQAVLDLAKKFAAS